MMTLLAAVPHIFGFLGLIVFGCAILAAVSVLPHPDPQRGDKLQDSLRIVGWILIVFGLLQATIFALCVPVFIGLVVALAVWQRHGRAQRHALLAAMAVAAERGMPLVPVLRAFQAEHRRSVARRAGQLADRLEAGVPLPDAVDATGGLFPAKVRLVIRMGYQSGQLPEALKETVDQANAHDTVFAQLAGKLVYLLLLPLFALSIVAFMLIWIVPSFQQIFGDFDAELPALTQFVIQASYLALHFWFLLVPFILLLGAAALYAILRYIGFIDPKAGGFLGFNCRLHTALIFDCLAMVARRNQPFAEAIGLLEQWYPGRAVRGRLARASRDVQQGIDWCESFRRRKLISQADMAVLQAAGRVGNLPWALHEMADANRRRAIYRAHNWMQVFFVLGIIGYGMVVFLLVVGMFMPLISLIHQLT